jgi:hypothetical protein
LRVKSSITSRFLQSRRVRYVVIALSAVLLLIFLVGSALLDGITFDEMQWEFWRGGLQPPTIIVYIILVSPIINNYWNRAVDTLLPLVKGNNGLKEKLVKDLTKNDRWRESGAALLAMILIVALSQQLGWPQGWFGWYRMVTQLTMMGLLGWLVYTGLRGTRNMTRLTGSIQDLDIFNLELLSPVARWSLGVSLAFIGGITISLIFVPYDSLLNVLSISVYGVLISTTILIFFVSLLSSHNAILRVKRRELAMAEEQLATAFRKQRGLVMRRAEETDEKVFSEVTAWWIYVANVRSIREWPYNASIIRTLLASLISPTIVYLIKVMFGMQFG